MTNQKKLKVIEEAFNYYHDRNSLTSKEEKEGTLKFIEDKNCLAFLPKRHTKTGQFLYTKFYYKLI